MPASYIPNIATDESCNQAVFIEINGKVIMQTEIEKTNETIDISGLPAGMYMTTFIGKDATTTQRFIKE